MDSVSRKSAQKLKDLTLREKKELIFVVVLLLQYHCFKIFSMYFFVVNTSSNNGVKLQKILKNSSQWRFGKLLSHNNVLGYDDSRKYLDYVLNYCSNFCPISKITINHSITRAPWNQFSEMRSSRKLWRPLGPRLLFQTIETWSPQSKPGVYRL